MMADIINPINPVKPIRNKQDAEAAATRVIEAAQETAEKQKIEFEALIGKIANISPELGGFEEFAVMLSLPDEQFTILAPHFLHQLEKGYHNINDQLSMVQMMNLAGIRSEDIRTEFVKICEQIDLQYNDVLSYPKRDFLKRMLGMTYNAIAEAEGISKKTITIPIEYCNENAQTPAYAHLTDAGMDVFALEDITIAPGETKLIPIGIKVALPEGYELQVRPKSGRCLKTKLRIANAPGTIDAGYRDEICVIVDNIAPVIRSAELDENGCLTNILWGNSYTIGKGEKFAQLVLSEVPKAVFYEVEEISEIPNDGRDGGFGSTGVK